MYAWVSRLCFLLVLILPSGIFAETKSGGENKLLSLGNPILPKGLQLSTNKTPGEHFSRGERVVLNLNSDKHLYALVIVLNPNGSASVLPANYGPVFELQPGKHVSVFGDDGHAKLVTAEKDPGAKVVIFLGDKFSLPPRKGPLAPYWTLDKRELNSLEKSLEAQEKKRTLYRTTLEVPDKITKFDLQVSRSKGLPGAGDSTGPESITGVQGVK